MKVVRIYMMAALLVAGLSIGDTIAAVAGVVSPAQHLPPPPPRPPDPLHIIKRHPRPHARRRPARVHINLPRVKLPPHPPAPPHP